MTSTFKKNNGSCKSFEIAMLNLCLERRLYLDTFHLSIETETAVICVAAGAELQRLSPCASADPQ
jgi:hypothetical protein